MTCLKIRWPSLCALLFATSVIPHHLMSAAGQDESPAKPSQAATASLEEFDSFVAMVDAYFSQLNEAKGAGRIDEAERMEDYIRYLLLAARLQREETNIRLRKLQQELSESNDEGNRKLTAKLRSDIRTVEDLLQLETKYKGFLPPRRSVSEITNNDLNAPPQHRSPWTSAEEYLRLELVKARVEGATLAAEHGSDHPKRVQSQLRQAILSEQLEELKATAKRESETTANPLQNHQPPDDMEARHQRNAERSRLEAERHLSEAELQRAETAADAAAEDYRDEAVKKQPAIVKLNRLKETLRKEVAQALKFQTAVQQHRLQLAEMDLEELKSRQQRRAALTAKIIERRVEELLSGEDLSWPQTATPEATRQHQYTFDTPEELLEYVEQCGRNREYHKFLGPLTEEALNGFAGMLLQSATHLSTFSPLAAVAENSPDAATMIEISTILARSKRYDPPVAAVAAHKQLTESMFLRTRGQQTTSMSPQLVYRRLQTAANVLKDPRQFAVEMMKAMESLNGDPVTPVSDDTIDWNVVINNDRAIATKPSNASDNAIPEQIDLRRIDGVWRISKLFSDDAMSLFAAGPHAVPTSGAVSPTSESLPSETEISTGHERVSFSDLAPPPGKPTVTFTEKDLATMQKQIGHLNGKHVRIRGHMYPTFKATGLTEFMMARDNEICCFVRQPKIHDIVRISLADGETTDYIEGKPFDVEGTFRIAPKADDLELHQLYLMDNARVVQ